MRDTIFISHATPEDNDFALWLAARLTALGYKTWVDKRALIGGETFWEEIDNVIRHEACKFVLVYSRHICIEGTPGRIKDGISKEISLAESIAKDNRLSCFLLFLNIDNSPFNLFIGFDRLNQIIFGNNWATGFTALIGRLEKDRVPKVTSAFPEFLEWFKNRQMANLEIIQTKELYYTNFWPIPSLPSKFYIYIFSTEDGAAYACQAKFCFPLSKTSNFLTSFASPTELNISADNSSHPLPTVIEVSTDDAMLQKGIPDLITGQQTHNLLVNLLARVLHEIMKDRGLYRCRLSNKKTAYFYTQKSLTGNKVSFNYPFSQRCKTKHLIGKYKDLGYWHFAVSAKPILTPAPSFSLHSHIIFTSDQFTPWDDAEKMHTHRRAKGKRMFNAEWRDLLLAFLEGLANEEGAIEIDLTSRHILAMPTCSRLLWSDFGYIEPTSDRLTVLTDESFDDDSEEASENNVRA